MRVEYTAIAGILILVCCLNCEGEGGGGDAGVGDAQLGDAAAASVDVFWNCACSYKCGLTLSVSESRETCRPTEAEAQQAAEELCNAKRNVDESCDACSCQCSTTNASCVRDPGWFTNTGTSGTAGAPAPTSSLYCCALGKLCSQSAVGVNPCQADANVSNALAAGDEQGCKAALDNAVLDVQVADCAADPNCMYTEADALAECQ